MSRCGKCRKFMNLIDKKPIRLFCRFCDEAYPLPAGGTVRLYKELQCPLDGFELVLISHPGSGGKSYPVCPMCFNDPPFEITGTAGTMNCHECPHATCKHSMASLGVCPCTQVGCTGGGTLCLDPESKPKWRLDCNKCNFQVRLFKDKPDEEIPHKIWVSQNQCEECNTFLLDIVHHQKSSAAAIGEMEYTGCIVCDDRLNSAIEGGFSRTARARAGGGKGGSRRRGGKGKKGGKNIDPRMTFDGF